MRLGVRVGRVLAENMDREVIGAAPESEHRVELEVTLVVLGHHAAMPRDVDTVGCVIV